MSAGHALIFSPDGTGCGLYTEAINLETLGDLTIQRASNIEFCNETGLWTVTLPEGGEPVFRHPSRQVCLDWERQYLEEQEEKAHDTG